MLNLNDKIADDLATKHLKPEDIGVLVVIARYMDKNNECYPSKATLQAKSGMGRDRLSDSLKRLYNAGHVENLGQRRKGNRASSNEYRLSKEVIRVFRGKLIAESQPTDFQPTENTLPRTAHELRVLQEKATEILLDLTEFQPTENQSPEKKEIFQPTCFQPTEFQPTENTSTNLLRTLELIKNSLELIKNSFLKEKKKNKKENSIEPVPIVPRVQKEKKEKVARKRKKPTDPNKWDVVEILATTLPWSEEEFRAAWQQWVDYKWNGYNSKGNRIGFKFKNAKSEERSMRSLHKLACADLKSAIWILGHCEDGQWEGFTWMSASQKYIRMFPLKDNQNGKASRQAGKTGVTTSEEFETGMQIIRDEWAKGAELAERSGIFNSK